MCSVCSLACSFVGFVVSVDDSATHFKVPEQKTRQERHTLLPNRAVRGVSLAVDDISRIEFMRFSQNKRSPMCHPQNDSLLLSGEPTTSFWNTFAPAVRNFPIHEGWCDKTFRLRYHVQRLHVGGGKPTASASRQHITHVLFGTALGKNSHSLLKIPLQNDLSCRTVVTTRYLLDH